jgi:alkanesulfonate monooxygenase
MRLGAFMRPVSIHTGAGVMRFIQTLERGRFDASFMADHLALLTCR